MNKDSTAIKIDHHGDEDSIHYESTQCACWPDIVITYTNADGNRIRQRIVQQRRSTPHEN